MKKKMLIVGITMNAAGSEKSFLSFAENIDYSKWDVELLLAEKTGDFLPFVPSQINIREIPGGEIFLIDRRNASKIIFDNYIRKNPLRCVALIAPCVSVLLSRGERKTYAKNRLWLKIMESLPEQNGCYDLAIAYWGDRTMFYVADKVRALRKLTWLHFDYGNPPRENALYEKYFLQFDRVVTVSERIEKSLLGELPSLGKRVITVENLIDREKIVSMSKEKVGFSDGCTGLRLLTVGRVCEQKGYDLALPALAKLSDEGFDFRWYVIGPKNDEYAMKLSKQISKLGLDGKIIYLGTSTNPYKYMNACDIYIQPSRHEGKSIAVEEAKVLCKPIFITDYSTAREQLCNGKYGLVGEISEDGIYRGVKKLLVDKALRNSLSTALSEANSSEKLNSVRELLDG